MERNNDLISRSALLEGLRELYGCMETCEECGCTAGKLIMNAPAATEKPQWIPVTERLPEPHNLVLCLWKNHEGGYYGFGRYQHDDVWYVSNEGMPEVTHWMPLPSTEGIE